MKQGTPIGVVGLSHLGIVAGAVFASLGYRVVGADSDAETVKRLQNGDCIVPEPGLQELFRIHGAAMAFTTDFSTLRDCAVVFIAKDTPTDEARNEMDLAEVRGLIDRALPYFAEEADMIVMSQVPVGFTRELVSKIRAARPGDAIRAYYFVETLIVGDAVRRFRDPERIMIGMEDPQVPFGCVLQEVLAHFACPVLHMKFESAEMTKAAINMYLATSVTCANTLANLCEASGADMREILPALRLDKRIGQYAYIKPGLGFSGGHLERDLVMLSGIGRKHSARAELLDVIQKEGAARYQWLQNAIGQAIGGIFERPKLALWGLAYKKNTDSTFRAPSIKVLRDFGGRADIAVYDPAVKLLPEGIAARRVQDKYDAVAGADALLILCDWDEFKDIDFGRIRKDMRHPLVIDGLGVLYDVQIPDGIRYIGMGV